MLQPNGLAISLVSDEVVITNIRDVFLVEFGNDKGIMEVISDKDSADDGTIVERPVATAHGLRLHRVIDSNHQVVTELDGNTNFAPLDFLKDDKAILASARPSASDDEPYTWQLIELDKCDESNVVAQILGMRVATPEENTALNEIYPGWLNACQALDQLERDAKATQETAPDLPVNFLTPLTLQ